MFNITSKYFSFFNNKPPASWVAHITRDFRTCYSCSYYSKNIVSTNKVNTKWYLNIWSRLNPPFQQPLWEIYLYGYTQANCCFLKSKWQHHGVQLLPSIKFWNYMQLWVLKHSSHCTAPTIIRPMQCNKTMRFKFFCSAHIILSEI